MTAADFMYFAIGAIGLVLGWTSSDWFKRTEPVRRFRWQVSTETSNQYYADEETGVSVATVYDGHRGVWLSVSGKDGSHTAISSDTESAKAIVEILVNSKC